jgi:HAD superfamily hydrolase (TIGR01459 family)
MTNVISSLADIADRYDAVLCDLWGCYHNGVIPHAGAISGLRGFRERGGIVSMLTNAPRPDFSTAKQLAAMGAPTDTHDLIVTSGDATIEGMRTGNFGAKCHHIGPPRDEDLFADFEIARVPLTEADFILCSGLNDDTTEGPENYAEQIALGVSRELPMVCANPDVIVDRGETRLYCGGAIAEAYAAAGGVVHLYGKPHAPIYEMAVAKIAALTNRDIPRARILTIGDGPATDVRGGAVNGFDTLFVAGGLGAEALLDCGGALRDDALADYFTEHKIAPTHTIALLR